MQEHEWSKPQWAIIDLKESFNHPFAGIITFTGGMLQVTIPIPSSTRGQQSDQTMLYPPSSVRCIYLVSEARATAKIYERENQKLRQIIKDLENPETAKNKELLQKLVTRLAEDKELAKDEELFQELVTRLAENEELAEDEEPTKKEDLPYSSILFKTPMDEKFRSQGQKQQEVMKPGPETAVASDGGPEPDVARARDRDHSRQ